MPNKQTLQAVRSEQEKWRRKLGVVDPLLAKNAIKNALESAKLREANSHSDDEWIYSSQWRYPKKLEQQRWQRTREIITRVHPGQDEDPKMLAVLARQAASVEMILREEHLSAPNQYMTKLLRQVLLATQPYPLLNAQSMSLGTSNYKVVWLSAGLMEFLYQLSKAVVLSWKLTPASKADRAFFSFRIVDTEACLAENPYPVDLLLGTLANYFFKGRPRHVDSRLPDIDYQFHIGLLTTLSERFIVAHEYSHALLHQSTDSQIFKDIDLSQLSKELQKNFPHLKDIGGSRWLKEIQADILAYHITLGSAWQFDLVSNEIALQGPLFALRAVEIFREALDIMRFGKIKEEPLSKTHPPTTLRIDILKSIYQEEASRNEGYDSRMINGALFPNVTLDLLWKRTIPQLTSLYGTAKLHQVFQ